MKGKIVFKAKAFPTLSETFVVNNVVEAIKNGFQAAIITDKKKSPLQSSQEKLLRDYAVLDKTFEFSEPKGTFKRYMRALWLLLNPVLFINFIKYIRYKNKRNLTLLFRLAFYYPYRKAIFHVHFATAIEPLIELKKIGFLKSKIIVTFHGYDAHGLPEGKPLDILVEEFSRYIRHITVNSKYLKNKLLNKGFPQSKISIVPIGIDFNIFKRNIPMLLSSSFNIISIGRLVTFKGHELGIKVVKILSDKGYNVKYTIIGEGSELSHLENLIEKLKLLNTVTLSGKKNQQEIKENLQSNHLFLMTSTADKTGRQEDFGVVSLEAQAMELPVIGFRSGGFPETVIDGKTGFLVEDKDIDAMAAVVEMLINDKKRLLQMGKQARKHVLENFSFERTTKKYLNLYN